LQWKECDWYGNRNDGHGKYVFGLKIRPI
jgi:hypothetical protein